MRYLCPMPKTKKILDRIQAVGATKKITQAMKMVAVAKLGKARERLHNEIDYIDGYLALFKELLALQKERPSSPLLAVRPVKKVLLLCLTTDRGLCGAFNQHVLKKTVAQYEAYIKEEVAVDLLPVGQKGFDFLQKKMNLPCLDEYVDICLDEAIEQSETPWAIPKHQMAGSMIKSIEAAYYTVHNVYRIHLEDLYKHKPCYEY